LVDGLYADAVAKIGLACGVHVGQVRKRDFAGANHEFQYIGPRDPVEEPRAISANGDEPRLFERLEMGGGGGQVQSGCDGQRVHRALCLRQQVEQLQALAVAQRLADPRELLKQGGLEVHVTHVGVLQTSME
jgi:hypothetical protein